MAWPAWTPDAFRPTDDTLVAVSVTATWDRWSVLLEEVLRDRGVAEAAAEFRLLSVDADRRPDLALRLAPAGLPVVAVLTPGGDPLVSTGFAPPRTIRETLRGAALSWATRRPMVVEQLKRAREAARAFGELRPAEGAVDESFVRSVVDALVESADTVYGGWGEGARVVNAASLRLLSERLDLAAARAPLEKTLAAMQKAAIRDATGGFSSSTETPDWESPDGVERVDILVDLHAAYERAGVELRREDFLETARGLAARLTALRDPQGLMPGAATSPDGVLHLATAESSFTAASAFPRRHDAAFFAARLHDPATGLFRRTPGAPPPFHLADQAAALACLAARENREGADALADALYEKFWDPRASAFRDRFAEPTGEPDALASPRFPTDPNAIAAGALALLGPARRDLARKCLSSFADALRGQGLAAARAALAAIRLA